MRTYLSPLRMAIVVSAVLAAMFWLGERAPRAGSARIVIVIGKKGPAAPGQHEYFAGAMLLARMLSQTRGVAPAVVRDGDPDVELRGARSIVFYCDGGDAHPFADPRWIAALDRALAAGRGLVLLHDALDVPEREGDRVLGWVGGRFKRGVSFERLPGWPAGFENLPAHATTRGVYAFGLDEEWQLDHEFIADRRGVKPILRTVPPEYVVSNPKLGKQLEAWAFERRGGGRSFAAAGPHYHDSWKSEDFRRLVTNAILWTAGIDVPADGAEVSLPNEELAKNLTNERP